TDVAGLGLFPIRPRLRSDPVFSKHLENSVLPCGCPPRHSAIGGEVVLLVQHRQNLFLASREFVTTAGSRSDVHPEAVSRVLCVDGSIQLLAPVVIVWCLGNQQRGREFLQCRNVTTSIVAVS